MYGGDGPDPDPTANAVAHQVGEQAAARAAVLSERQFVEKEAEAWKATFKWRDTTLDGVAPIVLPGPIPPEAFKDIEFDPEGAKEVRIAAGSAVHVPVVVDSPGAILSWEFKSDGEVGFRLGFTAGATPGDGGGGDESEVAASAPGKEDVIPLDKVASNVVPEVGSHDCVAAGTYVCTFDNKDSWVSSRRVQHRIRVDPGLGPAAGAAGAAAAVDAAPAV